MGKAAEKTATRGERQFALREMVRLADRRSFLLKEATRMINDDTAPSRDAMIEEYLTEMRELDLQARRSPLLRAYAEADWLDKAVVLFTGNWRDVALVAVLAALAAIVTWLVVAGQFGGLIAAVSEIFSAAPAIAAEPGLLLRDKEAVNSVLAMVAAVGVAMVLIVMSIGWLVTKNAAKRKEARDVLTVLITFLVGVLTGWAL